MLANVLNRQRRRSGGGGGTPTQPPANLTPPTISRNGLVLTCNPGDWVNNPTSITYRWLLNGTAVIGATSQTWTMPPSAPGALFGCELVGVNSAGQSLPALAQEVYIGILDVLSVQPLAGQSLWKDRAAQTQAIIARNSSNDPLTQDKPIGFSATGRLDLTALQAHCGTGTGFVPQWFNVSGNAALDATQAIATYQPRIVGPGGVVDLFDGNPFLVASNATTGITVNLNINNLTGLTIIGVHATYATQNTPWLNGGLASTAETGSWGGTSFAASTAGLSWRFGTGAASNDPRWLTPITAGKTIVTSIIKNGLNETPRLNGVAGPVYTAGASSLISNDTKFTIFGRHPSVNNTVPISTINNRIACWFIFGQDQPLAEMQLLEQNLLARYPTT